MIKSIFTVLGFLALVQCALATQTTLLEDFEDNNHWSPMSSLGWWHLDEEDVYRYKTTQEKVYNGQHALKISYEKTGPFQLLAGFVDSLNPKKDFSVYDSLQVSVYGSAKILLKLEDRWGKQTNVGIKTALDTDRWNVLDFDFSEVSVDLTNIKNVFFFFAPNESLAKGVVYIDDLVLVNRHELQGSMDRFLEHIGEPADKPMSIQRKHEGLEVMSAADMAKDSRGNLFVLHQLGGLIFRFDEDGQYKEDFGRSGDGPGQFRLPVAIELANDQQAFYVLDRQNQSLQKLNSSGQPIPLFAQGGQLLGPEQASVWGKAVDIAVDDQDMIYVLDQDAASVWIYDAQGQFVKSFELEEYLQSPVVMRIKDQHLIILDKGLKLLQEFNLQGEYVRSWPCVDAQGQSFKPLSFDFEQQTGSCFVISQENKEVYVFDRQARYLGQIKALKLKSPSFLRIFPQEDSSQIFIGDFGRSIVHKRSLKELQELIV